MQTRIDINGELNIDTDNETEAFALILWFNKERKKLNISTQKYDSTIRTVEYLQVMEDKCETK